MNISVDTRGAEKLTKTVLQQIPYAAALALTRTAQQAQRDILAHMAFDFDRPTPYTLNSLFIKPATKTDLTADVYIKNEGVNKQTPATKYLGPEVYGGIRSTKRSENALQRMGLMRPGSYMVPARGMPLDQYGNVRGSQMTKILSALGANPERYSNVTVRSRTKAIAAGRNIDLFVGSPGGGRLPTGVWQRLKTRVKPLLIFVDRVPLYRQRLKFYEIAAATYARVFDQTFNESLAEALRTARVR
jgi:hypothetical protein